MSEPAVEGVLTASGAATFTMLLGILYSQSFPRWRNYRRMFELGGALAGAVFVVALAVAALATFVTALLPIVVGAVLILLGAVLFFAASKGRYYGTVSDYRIIGRTFLIAGGAVLVFGAVMAL